MSPRQAKPSPLVLHLSIADRGWMAIPSIRSLARKAALAAYALAGDGHPAEASLLLTDDAALQAFNRDWRGIDKPTNVLAFANPPEPFRADGPPRALGDVAVALETVLREAAEQGKPPAAHLCHMVAHGLLHLLGRDHLIDVEAEAMENEERVVLARLGFPDPYQIPYQVSYQLPVSEGRADVPVRT
jgi:probable rRNA maturation factor